METLVNWKLSYVNIINKNSIHFSFFGWPFVTHNDHISILINKGYSSNDNKLFSIHKQDNISKKVLYPVVYDYYFNNKNKITTYTFEDIDKYIKFNDTSLSKSTILRYVPCMNAYVNAFNEPLTDMEILNLINIEKEARRK